MMFKITCSAYVISRSQRGECRLEFEPQYLNGKDGFVNAVKIKVWALSVTKNGIINAWLKQLSKGAITIEGAGTIAFREESGA